jgi:hypothetical protein
MALRAIKHLFTGSTTLISAYDPNKTNIGSLIVQKTGPNPVDKFIGPATVGVARPMQEVVDTVGTVTVSATAVTGSSTNFTTSMIGMLIGFGSTNPARVTVWYSISARASATGITLSSTAGTIVAGTAYVVVSNIPAMYPHVITFSSTVDWVFLIENLATAVAPRRILMYEYTKATSVYTWKGFVITTLTSATAHTLRGFRALRYVHSTGTVGVSATAVTGTGTKFVDDGIAVGARIGFGFTDPTAIVSWFVISAIGSDTGITLATSAGSVSAGTPYVIEELRFAITATNATTTNGGLHVVKGVNYADFVTTGTTIPVATTIDNLKAVYWLSDAGTTANVVTNTASCGLTIQPEVNKGLHYAYVPDGVGATFMKVYRYNLRATGTITAGKMLLGISYYTTGTVGVSGTVVTGSGTTFTLAMVGMRIGFGSTSPASVAVWYTIDSFSSTTSITLTTSAGTITAGTAFVVDSADVITTGNQLVTGTVVGINNGRIGTLNHGAGAGEESLYFVTSTRIYRAALSKIFSGSLGWISDNNQEVPTGGVSSFPATGALNAIEISDSIDRLIVQTTGATAFRHYVTRYPDLTSDPFDHVFGVDDKQQDQILAGGDAYIISGTVAVSGTAVTGTNTFFTSAMVGFRIGFGTTDPNAVVSWFTISAFTSVTSITLSATAGVIGAGSAYVIDWNSNTVPHFSSSSQVTSLWSQNGIVHIIKHGITAALCQMYSLPFGAHATYANTTNQRVITPIFFTTNCARFSYVAVNNVVRLGSGEMSVSPEAFKIYFRTKGIYSNSGEWTLVKKDGDLSSLAGSPRVQFMIEFDTIGLFCVPARIMSLTVVYDDTLFATDSRYQPSAGLSNVASKRFAWRFATAFGGTVPPLRVRLYNAINGDLLLDDYSNNSKGTWEKTTDGTTWGAYDTSDKINETTYVRFTPTSLGDNIKVRAVLTQ